MQHFDNFLINQPERADLAGWRRFVQEFLFFGIKVARACLFAGLFFVAVFAVPRAGLFGIPRYDLLLIIALGIQAGMLWLKLETWYEDKPSTRFQLCGCANE